MAGNSHANFEQMTAFYQEIMGLTPTFLEQGVAIFDLDNGDRVEVFGADTSHNSFMTHPIAGFLVDDIEGARAEMEAKGIEFVGPIHRGSGGYSWTHFRAPDGFIYELSFHPNHPLIQKRERKHVALERPN